MDLETTLKTGPSFLVAEGAKILSWADIAIYVPDLKGEVNAYMALCAS